MNTPDSHPSEPSLASDLLEVSNTLPENEEEVDTSTYGSDDITVLEGLEAVRLRPGMYIGSTSQRGLHHLIYEVMDNSVDEALAGHCDEVHIYMHPDNRVTVTDNGRGIPVQIQEQTGRPAAEVVLTVLHAGGKFGEGGGYKVSGGLHGVGISVVNALSEELDLTIWREGYTWRQSYARGVPTGDLERGEASDRRGTSVTFLPDAEIFEVVDYDRDVLSQRFREMAFLTRGLKIAFHDERAELVEEEYQYDGGIKDFVTYLHSQGTRKSIHPDVVYLQDSNNVGELEVALQWNDSYQENLLSFANNINTHEGGSHLSGFRSALTRTLNTYARSEGILKEKDANLTGEDVREGLTAIISVKIENPQFEGQTKTKLGNPPVEGLVNSMVGKGLSEFLEENPAVGRIIIQKALTASQARAAAHKARDLTRRKSVFENSTLPGKLQDCSNRDPARTELYIVEGDSAGGSAKQGRNRETQAILPLRGKIINAEKSRLDKVLSNLEVQALITAIGTGVRDEFDITKARYHKIVIMTDADVDGSHIRTLILTFFYRNMPGLIEAGYLYIAKPPLYKVKDGKNDVYIEKELDLETFILRDKYEVLEVTDAAGSRFSLTPEVWGTFSRLIQQYQGWSRKLQARYNGEIISFLQRSGLLGEAHSLEDIVRILEKAPEENEALNVSLVDRSDDRLLVKLTQTDSGTVNTIAIPVELFKAEEYAQLIKVHGALESIAGTGPFQVSLGARSEQVLSFQQLREAILGLAKEGVKLSRFKGLGEMNADQLYETTMDPDKRNFTRVKVDDASAADLIFSMLMGDEVPPRREFIETHARDVDNLDI